MRKTFYIVLFFMLPFSVLAQPAASLDFGVGAGMASYYGDINQDKFFYKPNFEFEGFIRYNFTGRYAVRVNFMRTRLEADDMDFDNSYKESRKASFKNRVLDISLLGEVNFFPYLNPMGWDTSRNTLYATLGPGVAIKYKNKDGGKGAKIPLIVMGVGYKRVLGSRFALEVEWAFRKCLNDKLDGVVDPTASKTTSHWFNNEWYNVLGVKLSYNLWSLGSKCRTFEKENDL